MDISEKSAAKINLTLDVLSKRADGYHEIESVMATIDLADRLDFLKTCSSSVSLIGNYGLVSKKNKKNLVYRAATLLQRRFGVTKGAHININKKIPIAAGLAGGSSNAAATLRGLNRLWGLNLSLEDLAKLGAEIGSDVPFCVYAQTAYVYGRGEIVNLIKRPPHCWVVLAKPIRGISTSEVFERVDVNKIYRHPRTDLVIEAIENGNYEQMITHLDNVLERVTSTICPEVTRLKFLMQNLGADASLMSGSGSTVYGLVRSEIKARRLVNGLKGFCKNVYMVRMLG